MAPPHEKWVVNLKSLVKLGQCKAENSLEQDSVNGTAQIERSPDSRPLQEGRRGCQVNESCRKQGIGEPKYCPWKNQFSGMTAPHLPSQSQDPNARLKRIRWLGAQASRTKVRRRSAVDGSTGRRAKLAANGGDTDLPPFVACAPKPRNAAWPFPCRPRTSACARASAARQD